MKYLKGYNNINESDYTDEILDKILSSGIESLSDEELKFMDAHKDGNEEEVLKDIQDKKIPELFEEVIENFKIKLEYIDSEMSGDFLRHNFKLEIKESDTVSYDIEGNITDYNGSYITNFIDEYGITDWDLFDKNDLKYDYEQFIELVMGELENNNRMK